MPRHVGPTACNPGPHEGNCLVAVISEAEKVGNAHNCPSMHAPHRLLHGHILTGQASQQHSHHVGKSTEAKCTRERNDEQKRGVSTGLVTYEESGLRLLATVMI